MAEHSHVPMTSSMLIQGHDREIITKNQAKSNLSSFNAIILFPILHDIFLHRSESKLAPLVSSLGSIWSSPSPQQSCIGQMTYIPSDLHHWRTACSIFLGKMIFDTSDTNSLFSCMKECVVAWNVAYTNSMFYSCNSICAAEFVHGLVYTVRGGFQKNTCLIGQSCKFTTCQKEPVSCVLIECDARQSIHHF